MNAAELLTIITQYLRRANVAVPIVFGVVVAIAAIIRGVTGEDVPLSEIAARIDKQVDDNDAAGKAEVAFLKALIG